MLEGLVTWVLNTYLGKYVENLNAHQISIALLQGEVELENLPLRRDALRPLGLPLEVRVGLLGRIKLQIPVRAIRSASWIIQIEQLYVVVGPLRVGQWDEEVEENAEQEYKQSVLDALEARWLAEKETQDESYYSSSYSSWLNYGTSIVTNVVENLQLRVKDVHIRFEDDVTIPGQVFACGITVEGLSAQSCDSTWTPRYLADSETFAYKLLKLGSLAMYWDILDPSQILGDLPASELVLAMSEAGPQFKSHRYVLSPVSAQAHVKRNRCEQPLRSRSQPRIVCDLELEEVPLSLEDWQYEQMVRCLKGLEMVEKIRQHRRHRPRCSVSENPRAWWIYMARCHRRHLRRASSVGTWEGVRERAKDNVAYVNMYMHLLANPTSTLQPEEKDLKDRMEHMLNLDELCTLREIARRKVREPKEKQAGTNGNGQGGSRRSLLQWLPTWWAWSSAKPLEKEITEIEGETPAEMPDDISGVEKQLEGQLLDALADSMESDTLLRRDAVFGQFNFTLKQGSIHFSSANEKHRDSKSKVLLEIQFENVFLDVEWRPRSGSERLGASLGAIYIWDRMTENSVFPVLVAPQGHEIAPSALGSRGVRAFPSGFQRLRSQSASASPNTSASSAGSTPNLSSSVPLANSSLKLNKSAQDYPLFQLTYERKPFNRTCDYRLHGRSQSLDIVYNPKVVDWFINFFLRPYQILDSSAHRAAKHKYQAMKKRTRQELLRNWERILEGHLSNRKTWELELDISAPQIIFVEHFCDKNAVIAVVDFGRLYLSTCPKDLTLTLNKDATSNADITDRDSGDDETYGTPCSTPPGSVASDSPSASYSAPLLENSISFAEDSLPKESLSETSLHQKLYDRYVVNLTDLQILVGKVKDNWKYAHLKGTSTLHVLDRFNISLQVERRVVFTTDPQYPSLTLSSCLPKLVVHINEQKVFALRTMVDMITGHGLPSLLRSAEPSTEESETFEDVPPDRSSKSVEDTVETNNSLLVVLQFSIDQLALEVQSRGRSVAELQVSGVKTSFTKRPYDTCVTLSVHSLLLVDALQTFGPDFELLVASHRHVGMDSVSGSLKDSEPTSPVSPGSPDLHSPKSIKVTNPLALSQALSSLQHDQLGLAFRAVSPTSPPPTQMITSPLEHMDHEALITIDILFVSPKCPQNRGEAFQVASIQFNNLDIIANQETIVELIGFSRRVFPMSSTAPAYTKHMTPFGNLVTDHSSHSLHGNEGTSSPTWSSQTTAGHRVNGSDAPPVATAHSELTFDFHRLNVLLLRAVLKDNVVVGRKIATATISEAKIQATLGAELVVEGSLGGLQVLDLRPEGQFHQRILSLGKDPLTTDRRPDLLNSLNASLYTMGTTEAPSNERQAFNFRLSRTLKPSGESQDLGESCPVEIKMRMASVWYTHSPCLVEELGSCATEFKQYLANLARSIRSAATEMALGLVHARAEDLAQSLYMSRHLSSSFSELSSPKRRRRSMSRSYEVLDTSVPNTAYATTCNSYGNVTPMSPSDDYGVSSSSIKLDIQLDTPVAVLPRSPVSTQVFVAHLGKISIGNEPPSTVVTPTSINPWAPRSIAQHYSIEIRDMNVFSLDIAGRGASTALQNMNLENLLRAEQLYACTGGAVPVLHDTAIRLDITRTCVEASHMSCGDFTMDQDNPPQNTLQVTGCVVTPLKVSLSRPQYEQLLETIDGLFAHFSEDKTDLATPDTSSSLSHTLSNIAEESELNTGVSTLDMDPALRARMLQGSRYVRTTLPDSTVRMAVKVEFNLPTFTLELRSDLGQGEQSLVDLTLSDLLVQFDHQQMYQTNIKMWLRSILVQDLLQPPDSRHRCIVVSSFEDSSANQRRTPCVPAFVSKSCPNLSASKSHQYSPSHDFGSNDFRPHGSLPDHLETESAFGGRKSAFNRSHAATSAIPITSNKQPDGHIPGEYPITPPPSPTRRGRSPSLIATREDNLVHIDMLIVDPQAPTFASDYNNTQRFINVDFNSLDIVANVESWVVILDFFGFGPSVPEPLTPLPPEIKIERESCIPETVDTKGDPAKSNQPNVPINSEFELIARSLTLVLNRPQYEVARANISQLSTTVINRNGDVTLDGSLGSMSLLDVTPHASLYRERFLSAGNEALKVHFFRYGAGDVEEKRDFDSKLKLDMSSVLYVHTQRFVAEILAFFKHFSQLQNVISSIRLSREGYFAEERRNRRLLQVSAGSPVLLLPLSSRSTQILVADLGQLRVTNHFLPAGHPDTISQMKCTPEDSSDIPILDVMQVELVNMDLYAGLRIPVKLDEKEPQEGLKMGSFIVEKRGSPLLREHCQLKLQVEMILDNKMHHIVPDISVRGTLSRLFCALDLSQYRLVRGLLSYNIGECLDDVDTPTPNSHLSSSGATPQDEMVWTFLLIHLDLVDVTVQLQMRSISGRSGNGSDTCLACINFIKSHLVVETFSNRSQDIDLVLQEISVTDNRFQDEPANKRSNVFTNILQPIHSDTSTDIVQAEIHHHRHLDYSKSTILLNNMRLMGILDWWEAVRDFISENAENPFIDNERMRTVETACSSASVVDSAIDGKDANAYPYEIKLNITNSEIVVVEDTSQWDTNAVILKSTTILTFKPSQQRKPLSCNLNHCEVFSCILGMEEDTALSIIDPATINMDLVARPTTPDNFDRLEYVLEVQMQQLSVRLSYHDVRMLTQMLNSLPQQTLWARNQESFTNSHPVNFRSQIKKLSALGFVAEDCAKALRHCEGELDEAALWLTRNAIPGTWKSSNTRSYTPDHPSPFSFHRIKLNTASLNVCVIDDCRDADVPLLELSLSDLTLKQDLEHQMRGSAECVLASDYYNRVLSGWEPFLEQWRCEVRWQKFSGTPPLVVADVRSPKLLNINITSTLVELFQTVKENWTQDYSVLSSKERSDCASKLPGSPPGIRRRSPFVPYAIRNDTGSRMWFTTLITSAESITDPLRGSISSQSNTQWTEVGPGRTLPFSFEGRGKLRHRNTHKLLIHQVGIRVDGWREVLPVSVDKVGVYFRQAASEAQKSPVSLPEARVVIEVNLEGSARKLVTVRSSLVIKNNLPGPIELRLDNNLAKGSNSEIAAMKTLQIVEKTSVPIPLTHALAQMWIRPVSQTYHAFSNRPISWSSVTRQGDSGEELHQCPSNKGLSYRLCAAIRRENYPVEKPGKMIQPAHTITLVSPLTIVNLLPHDVHFMVRSSSITRKQGVVKPGSQAPVCEVDAESPLELAFHMDNFPGPGVLVIPAQPTASFKQRLRLHDHASRRLFLHAEVKVAKGVALKVNIWAPYWMENKTGLPLVFRQGGVHEETAGQFEEHEMARMVAPLLFSYADEEASPSVVARVGNGVHPDGIPQWCDPLHLHPGVQFFRLVVSVRDSRPDIIYLMGVEVKQGRGRYRHTHIVTLSPHFQLHNRSNHTLQFAQKCFATTVADPGAQATFLSAVPNCFLPFHWPRQEKDQLLCVRLLGVPNCLWSGSVYINKTHSLHLNIRDQGGRMYFLRLEIFLQGATYFVVFSDASTMPPPIRIDNYAEVPIVFHQTCVQAEGLKRSIRPHLSMPYAWDEPIQSSSLTLVAPGGVTASYDMNTLGLGHELTYENFIYIAFTATFDTDVNAPERANSGSLLENQQLVLDVPQGTQVVLRRKEQGARSQLWRMTGEGQLQHEGSSPPRDPRSRSSEQPNNILVLDIAGPAPQPTEFVGLCLRRIDHRRKSTQTWRFTEDGRLCCAHNNLWIQAKDGVLGLRPGNEAVLGPSLPVSLQTLPNGIPLEQAVCRQRLRPGSGFLAVNVITDGPTRVLEITDVKEKQRRYALLDERDWAHISATQRPTLHRNNSAPTIPGVGHFMVNMELSGGIGMSLVSRKPPEELIFLRLEGIRMNVEVLSGSQRLALSVADVQVDNQLFEAQCPVLLYVNPLVPKHGGRQALGELPLPAITLEAERLSSPNMNAEIFKELRLTVTRLCLNFEERLILKLLLWAGYQQSSSTWEGVRDSDVEAQRLLSEATSMEAKRYYFGRLQLSPSQLRLSVYTSSKLPPELQAVKRKLGLRLIKFEDAVVDLGSLVKQHPFETSQFLFSSIVKHYQQVLLRHAHNILGSVDFLGNPLGFMSDVSEGVSGLIYEGNVSALVKNVTHGISNSTAKVTESLSDGLGCVIHDEEHEEMRQRIRSGGNNHLVAGFKGLGFGVLGGLTSIVKHVYEGYTNDGWSGVFVGVVKGAVGTVTKPVVGVLDLASEAASAVRDSSRNRNKSSPTRHRKPRCVMGPGGLLPPFSHKQSQGQEFLYAVNERDYSELFMAYEVLLSKSEDLRILVSSKWARVFSWSGSSFSIVIQISLRDLYHCQPVSVEENGNISHYIELTTRPSLSSATTHSSLPSSSATQSIKKPRVRCDTDTIAQWVSQQVNYARGMLEEQRYTLVPLSDGLLDD